MFYETEKNNHGLPYNPFKSCIIPRPIGWITSIDKNGNVNLAPYSYFNAVSDIPPMVIFSTTTKHHDGRQKDTLSNVEETKEFVVNVATWNFKQAVNITSADFDHGINEAAVVNLETIPSTLVKPPRIKGSPIQLECLYHQSIQLPTVDNNHSNKIIIGKVVGIHIDDEILINGKIDVRKFNPIARLGYMEYTVVNDKFEMERPSVNATLVKA